MLIYLASRYSRFKELQLVRADLEALGHSVTSRWINGDHQIDDKGLSLQANESERIRFASEDLQDLLAAETIISFTEQPRSTSSRGGRHVEFGIALGKGKRLIVIGPRENVFHCLPVVEWYPNYETFLADFSGAALDIKESGVQPLTAPCCEGEAPHAETGTSA